MNISTVLSLNIKYGVMILTVSILGLCWPIPASASVKSPSLVTVYEVRPTIDFSLNPATEEKQPELLAKGRGRGRSRSGHSGHHSGHHGFDNHGRHGHGFDDFRFDDSRRHGFGHNGFDDFGVPHN